MTERVFVFTEERGDKQRPYMYAFRESEINIVKSQLGSQNCFLVVNGIQVQGSFDDFVAMLGERVDVK